MSLKYNTPHISVQYMSVHTCYDVPHGYSIPTLIVDTNFGFALNFFPFRTVLDLTQLKLRYMFVDLKS